MAEQTEERLQRAMDVIVRIQRIDNPKTIKAFEPFLRKDAALLLAAIDGPVPDWADLREMARNAGWTRRTLARDWSVWMNGETSAHIRRRWPDGWKVTLAGDFGELALNEPTPARFFAVAREMGLGGGNDPR